MQVTSWEVTLTGEGKIGLRFAGKAGSVEVDLETYQARSLAGAISRQLEQPPGRKSCDADP